MSRHRAIRNLDLEEEFYDEDDGYGYDEISDLSEEDQLKLLSGIESIKKALGPSTGISDQEIKESLWYYYFDEAATIAWLRKTHKLKPKSGKDASSDESLVNAPHRPGNLPRRRSKTTSGTPCVGPAGPALACGGTSTLSSLKTLAASGKGSGLSLLSRKPPSQTGDKDKLHGSPSVVGKALAALKTNATTAASPSKDKRGMSGLPARQGLSLSQLAQRSSTTPVHSPVLKNFSGRLIPAPKDVSLDPAKEADPASAMSGLSQQTRQRMGLDMSDHQQPSVATLYAQPSSLARFILDGIAASTPPVPETRAASISVGGKLRSEIEGLINANRRAHRAEAESDCDRRAREEACYAVNLIARDVSFLNVLAATTNSPSRRQQFAFDTPSPDDKVLAAQRMAGSGAALDGAAARKKKER